MLSLADWKCVLAALPEPAALVSGVSAVIDAANPCFAALLGRAAEELAGKELPRLVDDEDRAALLTAIATGAETANVEIRVSPPHGDAVTLRLNFGPAPAAGPPLALTLESKPH